MWVHIYALQAFTRYSYTLTLQNVEVYALQTYRPYALTFAKCGCVCTAGFQLHTNLWQLWVGVHFHKDIYKYISLLHKQQICTIPETWYIYSKVSVKDVDAGTPKMHGKVSAGMSVNLTEYYDAHDIQAISTEMLVKSM